MYRNTDYSQMTIYDFIHPFGGHLDEENRWVKLHDLIDWDMIDEEYSTNFDNESGGQ